MFRTIIIPACYNCTQRQAQAWCHDDDGQESGNDTCKHLKHTAFYGDLNGDIVCFVCLCVHWMINCIPFCTWIQIYISCFLVVWVFLWMSSHTMCPRVARLYVCTLCTDVGVKWWKTEGTGNSVNKPSVSLHWTVKILWADKVSHLGQEGTEQGYGEGRSGRLEQNLDGDRNKWRTAK